MKDLMTALWETSKEPLRYLVIAIIPVLLTYLGKVDAQWAIIAIIVLRLIDKFLHEYKSTIETEGEYKGLVGF
jgi:hypothetical protein